MLGLLLLPLALAFDNGVARTPPLGWNSWNFLSDRVSSAALRTTADFLVSSGLAAAGYTYIISDDGWMGGRDNVTHRMFADPVKFPGGWEPLVAYIHSKGLRAGIYSAASSVVCSSRVGSLYYELIDARTFADWQLDYIKYDLCGEYAFGNSRFTAFMDAVNQTGRAMIVSTEPYSQHPTPEHKDFAHLWRTTNDIDARYESILDRIDTNDKWADFAAPGSWNDVRAHSPGSTQGSSAPCSLSPPAPPPFPAARHAGGGQWRPH